MANVQDQIPELVLARRPPPVQQRSPFQPYESRVNCYKISAPKSPIYHWDAISPDDHLSKGRRNAIFNSLMLNVAPHLFVPQAFFDGKANMFAFHDVLRGHVQREFEVNMVRKTPVPGQHHPGLFKVVLTLAQVVTAADLDAILSGGRAGFPMSTTPLQALDVLVKHSLQYTNDLTLKAHHNGLDILSGFFRSIRPMVDGLFVNVDLITVVNYHSSGREMLQDLVLAFLNARNLHDLSGLHPNKPEWHKLRHFLRGLKVKRVGLQIPKIRTVDNLVDKAGAFIFELKNGEPITVQAYFRQFQNITLRYPDWPGIQTKQGEVIPFELCLVLPGQRYRKQLSPEMMSKVLEVAKKRPEARFSAITSGVENLASALSASPCLFAEDKNEITLVNRPELVRGQLLKPPLVKYGQELRLTPERGAWNLAGDHIKLLEPKTIKIWRVIVFDTTISKNMFMGFLKALRKCMGDLGMKVDTNPSIDEGNAGDAGKVLRLIENTPQKPSLVLIVLPENAAEAKREVKHWGDIKKGVVTQCIKSSKLDRRGGAMDQYLKNLCLKINAKLGGLNHIPIINEHDVSCIKIPKTMIIGVDVSHPGPGVKRPSVASVVGSLDYNLSYYTAATSIQHPRVERLEKLSELFRDVLQKFSQYRWHYYKEQSTPEHIIIFRDGVSEGELPTVVKTEIHEVKKLLRSLPIRMPKVTFIVVGKRHHIRFAPIQGFPSGKSGNCPPGYVVDDKISTPGVFDFYLQSHEGILGTSRPGHYIVVQDENKFEANQLKSFCYAICHTSARTTRSLSIPAPVFYADLVCQRAEYHYKTSFNIDNASSVNEEELNMEEWQEAFCKINTEIGGKMYFV